MKKQIELRIEELVKKNRDLFAENAMLSAQLEGKDKLIGELSEKITALTELTENYKSIIDSLNSAEDNVAEAVYSDSSALPKAEENTADNSDNTNDKNLSQFVIDGDISSASVLIGKAVKECAAACNEFAEAGGSNAKDLINLALGRTEVFKSELLQIVSSDKSSDEKMHESGELFNSVTEYFNLLRSQIL